jgi:transcriptional regulator with XRE-family HTH domain
VARGDWDWDRLRGYVLRARVGTALERQADFADAVGVSVQSISNFERGGKLRSGTLAKIEDALGWEPGSAQAVLQGGVPVRADSTDADDREVRDILRDLAVVLERIRGRDGEEAYQRRIDEIRRRLRRDDGVPRSDEGVPPSGEETSQVG